MKNYWIFPALTVTCLSFFFFTNQKLISMCVILALIARLIYLHSRVVLGVSIGIGMIFLIYFWQINVQQTHPPLIQSIDSAVIYPDGLKVNGDSLTGVLETQHKKLRFFYRIKSQSEKVQWRSLSKAIDARVKSPDFTEIQRPRNPGEFDYKSYLNHQGIFQVAQIDSIYNITVFHPTDIISWLHVSRVGFLSYLAKLPKWIKIHAQSLLVGYSNRQETDLFKTLSTLGVIHLFSLSGLHVVILVMILMKLTSFLFITRESCETLMLALLPAYGVFVGAKTGISRAIVLCLVAIILKKMHYHISRLDIFSITVLICLILDPFSLVQMGGQLSFLLAGGLIFLKDQSSWLVTFKMNLLSLPLVSYYTYQFSWLILLMNLIFVPIFTYVILPTTILAALFVHPLMPVWKLLNSLFEVLYSGMDKLANVQSLNFISGRFWIPFILALVVFGLFNLESKHLWNLSMKYFLLIFALGVLVLRIPIFGSVSIIDVGQGDSIFVTTPFNRKTMLIDTGGKLSFAQAQWQKKQVLNQVEKSTIPYLKSRGISKIDEVFVSHKDSDHMGNLDYLLGEFPVTRVNFGIGLDQNKKIKSIINRHKNVKFRPLIRGDNLKLSNSEWQVLWPNKKSIGENGDSLTLLAKLGNFRWLFTGDLDIPNEEKIIKLQKFKVDYLKAGHHGSKTASGNLLLKTIQPRLALISAGINNRYGHPNKETLQRFDQQHIPYLNTADYGMITWYYFPFLETTKLESFLKGELIEAK